MLLRRISSAEIDRIGFDFVTVTLLSVQRVFYMPSTIQFGFNHADGTRRRGVEEYHVLTLLYNEFCVTSESISLSPFIVVARRSWAADRRTNVGTV